uniref:Uncharacterized protein n=1 Tax=Oryza glumipatula TaxID=40148 RepID=A0A0D9YPB6_9ORYZ
MDTRKPRRRRGARPCRLLASHSPSPIAAAPAAVPCRIRRYRVRFHSRWRWSRCASRPPMPRPQTPVATKPPPLSHIPKKKIGLGYVVGYRVGVQHMGAQGWDRDWSSVS